MSRVPTHRRLLSAVAAATVLGAGLVSVAATTGSGTASAAECRAKSTATKKDISTVGITHTYEKSTTPDIGPGAELTYTIRIGTTGIGNPYVNTVSDHPPVELRDVKPKVRVTALTLIGGILGQTGTPSLVDPTKNGNSWKVTNAGWFVNATHSVQFEYIYKLPSNLTQGKQITSGGVGVAGTVGVSNELPGLTACTTVRPPNAGEVVLGSLDSAGLGSADGQLSSTGSLEDMLPGIIGGIVGDIIGGL